MYAYANTRSRTSMLTLCGLFAAIVAIFSWISIPLGFTPIPVNLATLAVFLAGALLGPKYGTISLAVYAMVGAVGAPVFAGFRGGISVLAGPTGGYIIGYIVAAFVTGAIIWSLGGKLQGGHTFKYHAVLSGTIAFAMVCGLIACYALGTAWFMISTHTGAGAALVSCVIPFLPGDALKIIAGTILTQRIRRYL